MWEPRSPREPRSIALTHLRQLGMHESRLASWPPPHRDFVTPQPIAPLRKTVQEDTVKVAPRRGWFFKGKSG
jgi:hypothetical protein